MSLTVHQPCHLDPKKTPVSCEVKIIQCTTHEATNASKLMSEGDNLQTPQALHKDMYMQTIQNPKSQTWVPKSNNKVIPFLSPCSSKNMFTTAGHTSNTHDCANSHHAAARPQIFVTVGNHRITKCFTPKPSELVHRKTRSPNGPSAFEQRLIASFVIDQSLSVDVPLHSGSSCRL